jgi:segregation and condensation protein A
MVDGVLPGESAQEHAQTQILDLIVSKDDVSWKAIIFDLIATEQMDPWDINISQIAAKFIVQVRKLQEMDFRIGGKVVLASAVLLKLKAERLRDEELAQLDAIIRSADEPVDLGLEEFQELEQPMFAPGERPTLIPRTPQPRKRKVSVYDLVEALEKALEMDARRPVKTVARTLDTIDPPTHHIDISLVIREVYQRVFGHYEVDKNDSTLMFHHITQSKDPRDLVMAFIPLLHLENARKVDMEQPDHFGPISIHLIDRTPPPFAEQKEVQLRLGASLDAISAHVPAAVAKRAPTGAGKTGAKKGGKEQRTLASAGVSAVAPPAKMSAVKKAAPKNATPDTSEKPATSPKSPAKKAAMKQQAFVPMKKSPTKRDSGRKTAKSTRQRTRHASIPAHQRKIVDELIARARRVTREASKQSRRR